MGNEYTESDVCGPRHVGPPDQIHIKEQGCVNAFDQCPLAQGETARAGYNVVLYRVRSTATNQILRTYVVCDVGPGQRPPTIADIRNAVQRVAPVPIALAGGTRYVVGAAVVFYARSASGADPSRVVIPNIPLSGHKLTATLTLSRVVWSWGDGASDSVTVNPAGRPYDNGDPCESTRVCSQYVSHVFTRSGTYNVTAHAYWAVTVTIDGTAAQVPVAGGADRGDGAARTVQLFTARSVLVPR